MAGNLRSSGGFTLVEVLIAFAITALSLTVLMQLFSTSAVSARRSAEKLAAIEVAENRIAELSDLALLVPGTTSGQAINGATWRREITVAKPAADGSAIGLVQVAVWVYGPDGGELLRLDTARNTFRERARQ